MVSCVHCIGNDLHSLRKSRGVDSPAAEAINILCWIIRPEAVNVDIFVATAAAAAAAAAAVPAAVTAPL